MKKILTIVALLLSVFVVTGKAMAAPPVLSVKMEQPKSPTNINNIKLTVVALDRNGSTITVQCMKQAPGDGGFTQFGSTMTVTPNGGNSVICETPTSLFGGDGNYSFEAIASNGSDTITSNVVTVDYRTGGPSAPSYNGKERVNTCDYKIKFHTSNDGKTVKVEVYRSLDTSFVADATSRVDTIIIGSDLDGTSTTTPPTCNQEYYFAIRAFDSAGNGSNVVGDSITHTTTTTTTTGTTGGTSGASGGAIPAGTGGNVLGASQGPTGYGESENGGVLGEATPAAKTETYTSPTAKKFPTVPVVIGVVLLGVILFAFRKKE